MDEQRGLSQVERVVNMFVAPSATFKDILRSTSWWLPFVLTVAGGAGSDVCDPTARWAGSRWCETQMQMSPSQQSQLASLTPAQQATADAWDGTWLPDCGVCVSAAVAGASRPWRRCCFGRRFNFGLGARTTYGQIFCLWMYCSLPHLLAALITVVRLCFGGNAESFDLKEPVGTNLGYYLPDASPWLQDAAEFRSTWLGSGRWCCW